jgi:putative DNA primase/helicase
MQNIAPLPDPRNTLASTAAPPEALASPGGEGPAPSAVATAIAPVVADDEASDALALLFPPGLPIELLLMGQDRPLAVGLFDHPTGAFDALRHWRGASPTAVYYLLNETTRQVPPHHRNCFVPGSVRSKAGDIRRRRKLCLDFDPQRPPNTSATHEEHTAALALARTVQAALALQGWQPLGVIDSGNGAHLIYDIDLPADDGSTQLLKGVLAGLARQYSTASVKVDSALYDAPRICRLPGTRNAKGTPSPARPHRRARLLESVAPDQGKAVRREQLEDLVRQTLPPALDGIGGDPGPRHQERTHALAPTAPPRDDAVEDGRVRQALGFLRDMASDYEPWLAVGQALHHWDQGGHRGYSLWREFSQWTRRSNFADDVCAAKWRTFGAPTAGDPLTIRSLLLWAKERGWDSARIPQPPPHTDADVPPAPAAGLVGHDAEPPAPVPTPEWPDPQWPDRSLPTVEPLTPDMLPERVWCFCVDIAARLGCAVDYAVAAVLTALGAVVGRQLAMHPKEHDDWLVFPNVWTMIVGAPGTSKSPAMAEALAPIAHLEREAWAAYQSELSRHRLAVGNVERRQAAAKKLLQKAADAAFGLADKKPLLAADVERAHAELKAGPPSEPTPRRYLVNDATVEALLTIHEANPHGFLHYRDEALGWLRSLEREGHQGDRPLYIEAWSGSGAYASDRIGRGHTRVEGLCIGILASIQPGPLSVYMAAAARGGFDADGLMARFMLIWPDRPTHCQPVDRAPDLDARREVTALFQRLAHLDTHLFVPDLPTHCVRYLRFAPDAQARFTAWMGELITDVTTGGHHEMVASALDKHRKLVPALALLFHLANLDAHAPAAQPVSLAALEQAIRWGRYVRSHLLRAYDSAANRAKAATASLAQHIAAGDLGTRFTARQVQRRAWAGTGDDREVIADALAELADLGWVRSYQELKTGGRPAEWFEVNPKGAPHG